MMFTELELKVKNMSELRRLAAIVGVARFSVKTSSELIRDILSVQEGRLEPVVHKRGRPKKELLEKEKKRVKNDENTQKASFQEQENSNSEFEISDESDDDFVIEPILFDFSSENFKLRDSQTLMVYDDFSSPTENLIDTNFKVKAPVDSEPKKVIKPTTGRRSAASDTKKDIRPKKLSAKVADESGFYEANSEQDSSAAFDAIGIIEVLAENYGYLRTTNYYPSDTDLYVPYAQIKRFSLRSGDRLKVKGRYFPNNKHPSVVYIYEINGIPCEKISARPNFTDLLPVYPTERIRLEDGRQKLDTALRVIDLVSPIGRGQRGLIISPPKAGKTTLLKSIAQAILRNYKDIELTILLVDERPEEVTDIRESVGGAEIVYSTFDMPPEHHTKVAELVMQNSKRRVEIGKHVVILLDSITRLSRAYNQVTEQTGKTLTGGLDSAALFEPKRFFGAARSIRNGGSLTVIATALIDTGSKMDDIIYEEFKGTGNMEIHLSRRLSERRIFPAVDLNKSGTRREELLLTPKEMEGMWLLRKILSKADTADATEMLLDRIMATKNNSDFIDSLKSMKI